MNATDRHPTGRRAVLGSCALLALAACRAPVPRLEPTDPLPRVLIEGEGEVLAVAFAGDDALITVHDRPTVWREGPVVVCAWDRASGALRWEQPIRRRSYETKEDLTIPLAVSGDGRLVASAEVSEVLGGLAGGLESRVFVWSVADGALVRTFDVARAVSSVAFRPGGEALVVAATDRRPYGWGRDSVEVSECSLAGEEAASPVLLTTIEAAGGRPRLARDGGAVAVQRLHGDRLLEVHVHDLERRTSTTVRSDRMAFFEAGLDLAEARDLVAVCNSGHSWPNSVEVWSLPGGEPLVSVHRGGNRPTCVALSPDGSLVAAGTLYPGGVWLLDIQSGEELARLGDLRDEAPHEVGRVSGTGTYCLAFAPDGRALAAGTSLGSVVLWDVEALRAPRTVPEARTAEPPGNSR